VLRPDSDGVGDVDMLVASVAVLDTNELVESEGGPVTVEVRLDVRDVGVDVEIVEVRSSVEEEANKEPDVVALSDVVEAELASKLGLELKLGELKLGKLKLGLKVELRLPVKLSLDIELRLEVKLGLRPELELV
jgi:hypothetical protein